MLKFKDSNLKTFISLPGLIGRQIEHSEAYGETYVVENNSQQHELFAHLEVEAHLEFIGKIERCIPRAHKGTSE